MFICLLQSVPIVYHNMFIYINDIICSYLFSYQFESLYNTLSIYLSIYLSIPSPFGKVCRICRLHLCRGVRTPLNESPEYDLKLSDGEAPVLLELWRMWSTPSASSPPGPLWPGVTVPVRVPSMGQIELFNHLLYWKTFNSGK